MTQMARKATPDGRFTYLAAGQESAVPVVFLHGIGGGAAIWARQLEPFGASYRALAWDMPGYGGSEPLAAATVGTYGDALGRFIGELGLDRPILVGHSIGGMVAQSYVADELGPVRALVLAQTTPAFGGRDPRWAQDFVEARLGPLERGATMRSLAPGMAANLLGDDPDPSCLALAEECISAVPEATWKASVLALLGFDRREALGRIAVPTLLIAGSKDTNAPASSMAKMAEKVPGAEYLCMDGVGHLAFAERPDEFNGAVLDFLDRRLGTGEGAARAPLSGGRR